MAARLTPATQTVPLAGLAVALTGPSVDGDVVDVGPGIFLVVNNGSGGSINVTVQTPGTVDGDLAVPERIVAVAAGVRTLIPLTSKQYKRAAGVADAGKAYVDYSAVASVTRGVARIA
jgi:hypothetical protein